MFPYNGPLNPNNGHLPLTRVTHPNTKLTWLYVYISSVTVQELPKTIQHQLKVRTRKMSPWSFQKTSLELRTGKTEGGKEEDRCANLRR